MKYFVAEVIFSRGYVQDLDVYIMKLSQVISCVIVELVSGISETATFSVGRD